jgi:hypothetical protein
VTTGEGDVVGIRARGLAGGHDEHGSQRESGQKTHGVLSFKNSPPLSLPFPTVHAVVHRSKDYAD